MKVLLHVCCGVCFAGAAERLISEGYAVTGYFYNPNIYPEVEYRKRLEAAREAAAEMSLDLIEGAYDPDSWNEVIHGLEQEPEGGKRCDACFQLRLLGTYRYLEESDCDLFATTLTVSPRKSPARIGEIGTGIGGSRFLMRDFKKKDGFTIANRLSVEWGIYRQHYCGCEFSLPEN